MIMAKSVARLFAIIVLALLAARLGFVLWGGWQSDLQTDRYLSLCGCAYDAAVLRHGQVRFTVILLVALSALSSSVLLYRWPRSGLLALAVFFCCMALPPWINVMAPLLAPSVPAAPHDATALPWSGACVVLSGLCALAFAHTRRRSSDRLI